MGIQQPASTVPSNNMIGGAVRTPGSFRPAYRAVVGMYITTEAQSIISSKIYLSYYRHDDASEIVVFMIYDCYIDKICVQKERIFHQLLIINVLVLCAGVSAS